MSAAPPASTDNGYAIYHADEIMSRLSGSAEDLQRRTWLFGRQNTEQSFSGIFTRKRRNDLLEQPWRYHPVEEVEYIVEGAMIVQFGDADGNVTHEFTARKGDLFYIKSGVPHRADAVGDELCVGLLFCPEAFDLVEGQPSAVA